MTLHQFLNIHLKHQQRNFLDLKCHYLQGFREDRRNVSKAVYPLYYGAYSSHGPTYDSTFANLTKEETELIYK